MKRPAFCTDNMLRYLDELQESGKINMLFSGGFVQNKFRELSRKEVKDVVLFWMKSKESA